MVFKGAFLVVGITIALIPTSNSTIVLFDYPLPPKLYRRRGKLRVGKGLRTVPHFADRRKSFANSTHPAFISAEKFREY